MTEAEWISSTDPAALLRWLTYATGGGMGDGPPLWFTTDRKLRLYDAAVIEYLDMNTAALPGARLAPATAAVAAALLRCVIGNPFRPPWAKYESLPAWRDPRAAWLVHDLRPCLAPAVLAIARTIYDERRFAELPILADALEDAGCPAEVACPACGGKGELGPRGGRLTKNLLGEVGCEPCGGSGRLPNPLLAHLRQADVVCPQCGGKPRGVPARGGGWTTCPECRGRLRMPAPHALPGCHVVSLILGKD